ncbi:MAG: PAS-domain containing protein [Rhodobacteraceae bacterium]|nr:PAS-domain containing protein [Paracoccaceae bacterium]
MGGDRDDPRRVRPVRSDDRLVICNERYRAIYSLSADAIRPGAPFEDILRHGVARGQFADALGREDAWIAARLAEHADPPRAGSNRSCRTAAGCASSRRRRPMAAAPACASTSPSKSASRPSLTAPAAKPRSPTGRSRASLPA